MNELNRPKSAQNLRIRRRFKPAILKKSQRLQDFRYSLKFTSLLPPARVGDMRLFLYGDAPLKHKSQKLMVKQSYMLMAWAAYTHNNATELEKGMHRPSFASLPKRRTRFTILKAPMAHKTFSQEQYQFQRHTVNLSFGSQLNSTSGLTLGVNESLLLGLTMRKVQLTEGLGTNLFLLSRVRLTLRAVDAAFFLMN